MTSQEICSIIDANDSAFDIFAILEELKQISSFQIILQDLNDQGKMILELLFERLPFPLIFANQVQKEFIDQINISCGNNSTEFIWNRYQSKSCNNYHSFWKATECIRIYGVFNNLEKYLRNQMLFYLDNTRIDFILDFSVTCYNIFKARNLNPNGCHRLLLGCKGVGKSSLLEALIKFLPDLFKEQESQMVAIFHDYQPVKMMKNGNISPPPLPSDIILEYLEEHGKFTKDEFNIYQKKIQKHPSYLEKLLANKNLFAICVFDEMQNVYLNKYGSRVISELFVLGGLLNGRVYIILTGNMKDLRALCFDNLDESDRIKFPGYIPGSNLNSTKFKPKTIKPMMNKEDFEGLCMTISLRPTEELYNWTGGVPGTMRDFLSTQEKFPLSAKDYLIVNGMPKVILHALARAIDYSYSDGEFPYAFTKTIFFNDFMNAFNEITEITSSKLPAPLPKVFYDLADEGIIQYDGNLIGFGSLYISTQSLSSYYKVIEHEAQSLRNPSGENQELAEKVIMKYVAKAGADLNNDFGKKIFGFNLSSINVEDLLLNEIDWSAVRTPNCLVLYKEKSGKTGKDILGADGVILQPIDSNQYCAHRIQIKLASKPNSFILKGSEADKKQTSALNICKKFEENKQNCIDVYNKCKINLAEQKFYLLTNCIIDQSAETCLKDHGISIIDRFTLATYVFLQKYISNTNNATPGFWPKLGLLFCLPEQRTT